MKTSISISKNIYFRIFIGSAILFTILFAVWGFSLKAEIVEGGGLLLGRGPNCDRSRGLCSVEESSRVHLLGNEYTNSSFSVATLSGLKVSIAKSEITYKDANIQFENGHFIQQEELTIPDGLRNKLPGLKEGPIAAGGYPVTETNTHFIIDFSTTIQIQSQ